MKKKIRDNAPLKKFNLIKDELTNIATDSIHFSFKHLDTKKQKFSLNGRNSQYFEKMLERLKNICLMTKAEVISNRSKSLRAHQIDWKDTTEPNGFSQLNEQLQQANPYQFEISVNKHGRVHGFFIENIFFIVWFDPDHKLYK